MRRLQAGSVLLLALAVALAGPVAAQSEVPDSPDSPAVTNRLFLPVALKPVRIQPAAPAWLAQLNNYRSMAGLPPASEDPAWSAGARQHAAYMAYNDAVSHNEDAGNPWYTPEGAAAAATSNVMGTSNASASEQSAIDLWMVGPFHALGILDPRLARTGFGSAVDSGGTVRMAAALDVLRGLGAVPAANAYPYFWPGNGAVAPLNRYTGGEYPDPVAGCGYATPTGLPLVVQLGSGNLQPNVTGSSLTTGSTRLAHCVYSELTFASADANAQSLGRSVLGSRDAVVLVPQAPLTPGAEYTASITADGRTYSWRFRVSTTPVR